MSAPPAYPFPLAEFLDLRVEPGDHGTASARLTLDERHMNPHGVVHGAVLFAMVDTAMGAAVLSVLDPGQTCASTDVQIRFVRGASGGELHASVEVSHQGRSHLTLEGRVAGDDGRPVAFATGAFRAFAPR